MGKLSPDKILKRVEKEEFESVWKGSTQLLPQAARVEEAVEAGVGDVDVRARIAKRPSDVNIRISDVARRYITGKKRKIDVAGPIFIGVRVEIAEA